MTSTVFDRLHLPGIIPVMDAGPRFAEGRLEEITQLAGRAADLEMEIRR